MGGGCTVEAWCCLTESAARLAGSDQDMRCRVKGEGALHKAAVANGAPWLMNCSSFFFVTTAAGSDAGGTRREGGREEG